MLVCHAWRDLLTCPSAAWHTIQLPTPPRILFFTTAHHALTTATTPWFAARANSIHWYTDTRLYAKPTIVRALLTYNVACLRVLDIVALQPAATWRLIVRCVGLQLLRVHFIGPWNTVKDAEHTPRLDGMQHLVNLTTLELGGAELLAPYDVDVAVLRGLTCLQLNMPVAHSNALPPGALQHLQAVSFPELYCGLGLPTGLPSLLTSLKLDAWRPTEDVGPDDDVVRLLTRPPAIGGEAAEVVRTDLAALAHRLPNLQVMQQLLLPEPAHTFYTCFLCAGAAPGRLPRRPRPDLHCPCHAACSPPHHNHVARAASLLLDRAPCTHPAPACPGLPGPSLQPPPQPPVLDHQPAQFASRAARATTGPGLLPHAAAIAGVTARPGHPNLPHAGDVGAPGTWHTPALGGAPGVGLGGDAVPLVVAQQHRAGVPRRCGPSSTPRRHRWQHQGHTAHGRQSRLASIPATGCRGGHARRRRRLWVHGVHTTRVLCRPAQFGAHTRRRWRFVKHVVKHVGGVFV